MSASNYDAPVTYGSAPHVTVTTTMGSGTVTLTLPDGSSCEIRPDHAAELAGNLESAAEWARP